MKNLKIVLSIISAFGLFVSYSALAADENVAQGTNNSVQSEAVDAPVAADDADVTKDEGADDEDSTHEENGSDQGASEKDE